MHKETVTYTDYDGTERTEDFYFNVSTAEAAELQATTVGGYSELITKAVNAKDKPTLVKIMKEFILRSYGQKSADGRRFIKTKELTEEFTQTEAYSIIFMKLANDDEAAAKFINETLPNKNKQMIAG